MLASLRRASASSRPILSRFAGASAPMSSAGEFHSVERILEEHLPPQEHAQVCGALFGLNQGKLVEELEIPAKAKALAEAGDFDVHLHKFGAAAEQLREQRIVRFGVTQNAIISPTTAPIDEQYETIRARHEEFVVAAAAAGTNVLCFQEAWTMPFAFCTREKQPWLDFAECAETGRSTQFCKKMAKAHNMVIVSPILERDLEHGDTIWNTAVVIGNNGNVIGKHRKNRNAACVMQLGGRSSSRSSTCGTLQQQNVAFFTATRHTRCIGDVVFASSPSLSPSPSLSLSASLSLSPSLTFAAHTLLTARLLALRHTARR